LTPLYTRQVHLIEIFYAIAYNEYMAITIKQLKALLVAPGYVGAGEFDAAVRESHDGDKDFQDILVGKGLMKDDQLGQLMAEYYKAPFVKLSKERIDETIVHLIPEIVSRATGLIIFERGKDTVKVGMVDPENLEAIHLIEKRTGLSAIPHLITKRDLIKTLSRYTGSMKNEFEAILRQMKDASLTKEERDSATVKIVNTLLLYAAKNGASDVHIEPYREKILVRFRIDGVLHDILDMPKNILDGVVSRIKVLAKMRTDEHRAAQDGKFSLMTENNDMLDMRISIVPVIQGENVVIRLLSAENRQYNLSDLGLSAPDLKRVERGIRSPHGMILVTGPTGSGKTTMVYAVLKSLNVREVHISTIEDPVEYDIENISQIQVNPKTNLTFAKGLRALLRQDPDIIMVGEIRDEETAAIAVNASMTGHLVLSTLHANDTPTTLPRLLELGVDPFLVASTTRLLIAQRLVRKICEKCRASYNLSAREKALISEDARMRELFAKRGYENLEEVILFKGAGCKLCGDSGYSGRIGIFEVLDIEENIRDLIVKRATSDAIMETARKNGMTTMLEDGIEKVFSGITTVEEVLRVTKE